MRAVFREEQKALPPPHPVGTTSDRPHGGAWHPHTRRPSRGAGQPPPRPRAGAVGDSAVVCVSQGRLAKAGDALPPRGGKQRGQDATRPERGGRTHLRGPGLTPACRRHGACARLGGSCRRGGRSEGGTTSASGRGDKGLRVAARQEGRPRSRWASGSSGAPRERTRGGPTATAQGRCVRPRLTSPGRRGRVHHVGDVPPRGGQLTQPASQPREAPRSAKVTPQPTDTAGSHASPADSHRGRHWGECHHHRSGTRWLDVLTDATPCWYKRPFTSLRFSAGLVQAIDINSR